MTLIYNSDYDVVLTGETHGTVMNYITQLEFIKYLNHENDKLYIISEMGYGSARLFSRYINTGNEKILEMVFDTLEGTASDTHEAYKFWQTLYEYNRTLDEDKKLEVYGVDIEHEITAGLLNLYLLPYDKEVAKKYNEGFDAFISTYNDLNNLEEIEALVEIIKLSIDKDEEFFRRLYGEHFFDFKMTINNMYRIIEINEDPNFYRDELMYETFKELYEALDTGVFFGQFGSEHMVKDIYTSFMRGDERFAMKLERDTFDKKLKVLSIMYLYTDSERMVNSGEGSHKIYQDTFHTEILRNPNNEELLLFDLNTDNSPFTKALHFFGAYNREAVTTDFVDYFLLINGSEGTKMMP